jgi:hypothetical protein
MYREMLYGLTNVLERKHLRTTRKARRLGCKFDSIVPSRCGFYARTPSTMSLADMVQSDESFHATWGYRACCNLFSSFHRSLVGLQHGRRGQHGRHCYEYASPTHQRNHCGKPGFSGSDRTDAAEMRGALERGLTQFGPMPGVDATAISRPRGCGGNVGQTEPRSPTAPCLLSGLRNAEDARRTTRLTCHHNL